MAADLPESVMIEPVPSFSWTGFYVGAQGGYGWGESKVKDRFGLDSKLKPEDFFLGAKAGALYQMNAFVIGAELEGNYSWLHERKNIQSSVPGGNFLRTNIDWFGSLSAKAGVAFDRVLVYATGGVALARIESAQTVPVLGESFSRKKTEVGFTVGGGVDFAVTDNIVVGAQYRYYDFGKEKIRGTGFFTDRKNDVTIHTLAASVSYKF